MLSIIACVDENNAIGYKNDLLFDIKEDMDFFKKMTSSKVVVMGRKTYYSLRKRPLPNRINIVMTKGNISEEEVITVKNLNMLGNVLKYIEGDIFIIGGQKIYTQLLPCCKYAYITRVLETARKADTYFPPFDNRWRIKEISPIMCENGTKYQRYVYENLNVKPIIPEQ